MLNADMLLLDALGSDVRHAHRDRLSDLPHEVLFGSDAAERLADSLARDLSGRRATVLFDARTRKAAGRPCLDALRRRGFDVRTCLVADRDGQDPVCDDLTHEILSDSLERPDALVAVGSGVINDLTKWLAADGKIPYAVFATAASMNGYASANVAPRIGGVKTLVAGRAARVVAADPAVLAAAPHSLTAAGFGDLLAKPVSTADWLLNHMLFGEPFSPSLATLLDRFDATVFSQPEGLVVGQLDAFRSLFEALVLSGCTMTLHGSSLPASGGEHVISHTLDMMSETDGVAHDLHGRQVGVATVVAATLWERILRVEPSTLRPVYPPLDSAIWGPALDAVTRQHEAKRAAIDSACAKLIQPTVWESIRERIGPLLLEPSQLRERLRRAGGAASLADIGCSRERFLTALRHGGAMRGRFTSLDFAYVAGVLPAQAEEIVDTWVV